MKRRTFLQAVAIFPLLPSLQRLQTAQPIFYVPPTTLHVTPTSATVYTWLSVPGGMLQLTREDGLHETIPLMAGFERQLIKLRDLEPGTYYQYRVEVDGQVPAYFQGERWPEVQFQTPLLDPTPFSFAVVGDSGYGDKVTEQLAAIIADEAPDFILHTGDIVYRSEQFDNNLPLNWAIKYYLPFRDVLAMMPHYPALGNHDQEAAARLEGTAFYYHALPPLDDELEIRRWYAFRRGDVQFICLNTQTFYNETGLAEQDAWLRERLADQTVRTNVIFFHVTMWTSATIHPNDGAPVAAQWRQLFASYAERIAFIFSGHAHLYERFAIDGITYITTGGGSLVIYQPGQSRASGSQVAVGQSHAVFVTIDRHQAILRAISADDTIIDEISLEI